jgi:hypothetical protein
MKRRLIAVTLLAAATVLSAPTVASASIGNLHVGHIKTNGPPYCC